MRSDEQLDHRSLVPQRGSTYICLSTDGTAGQCVDFAVCAGDAGIFEMVS